MRLMTMRSFAMSRGLFRRWGAPRDRVMLHLINVKAFISFLRELLLNESFAGPPTEAVGNEQKAR